MRVVGAGVEVHGARVDPPHHRRRRHREGAEDLVRARLRQLGLGGRGTGDLEAKPVVALSRDAQRVDRLADAARGADPVDAVLLEGLDALSAHVLVGGPGPAVAAGERREGLGGGVVDPGRVREEVQAAQHQARPLGVRDEGRGPHVAVEREQGDDGDDGHEGHGPERAHQNPRGRASRKGALEPSV